MTRPLRVLIAALLVGLFFALPGVALGQEAESEDAEPAPIAVDSGAAVDLPPIEIAEQTAPWTQRFLIPAIVALTVVIIGGVIVYYLVAIKGRYTVAPE